MTGQAQGGEAVIVIRIKVGGNFQLSILIHKIEADDVGQALILKKMFCFSKYLCNL